VSGLDGRVCALEIFNGSCAYMFDGNAGENHKLSQTFTLPANLKPPKGGQIFIIYAIHATSPATNFKVMLTIKYTDGKKATKLVRTFIGSAGPDYTFYQMTAVLASKKVGKMTLTFHNKSTAGLVFLDTTGAGYRGGFTRSAQDGVLPLPAVGQ
jgi:hypothetical protein